MDSLRIVVPIDLAGNSETAFEMIRQLSGRYKTEVVLVHVLASPVLTGLNYPDMGYIGDMQSKVEEAAHNQMEQIEKLGYFSSCAVTSKVIAYPANSLGKEIADYAASIKADLLLLISRHRGGLDSFFEGTHLMHLLRQSRVPTLVLSPGHYPALQRIAFATDLSGESVKAVRELKQFTDRFQAGLNLFTVVTPEEFMSEREFTKQRNEFTNQSGPLGFGETSIYNAYSLTFGISNYAEDHACDTIALATHGRRGLSRVFSGSICEAVIRSSKLPLLVFNLSQ